MLILIAWVVFILTLLTLISFQLKADKDCFQKEFTGSVITYDLTTYCKKDANISLEKQK